MPMSSRFTMVPQRMNCEMFEAGNLSDVNQLRGPSATSLFTDQKDMPVKL